MALLVRVNLGMGRAAGS